MLLSALGPATDADSLNYHLGVPLDILRHHRAYPRPDWLFARLAGLGESLNMLGLAGGTDILGALLQFSGLIAAVIAVNSFAKTNKDRILLTICVLGCPVVAHLVPSQKPQMLPIAATTVAIILIAQRFKSLEMVTLVLSFGCVFFAISCKYSFIISGSLVVLIGLFAAYKAGRLPAALLIALIAYLLLVFPVQLQNYLFYGDPVSPFLEKLRPHGEGAVLRFASFYRNYDYGSWAPFPLNLFIPSSPGEITTVIGLWPLPRFVGTYRIQRISCQSPCLRRPIGDPF